MVRRFVISAVLFAGLSAGSAGASAPQRFVYFTDDYEFYSQTCSATIAGHDDGRIAVVAFFNRDGSLDRIDVEQANLTSTFTNEKTGTTVTVTYSAHARLTSTLIQTSNGLIDTESQTFTGLNYILRTASGPPVVSAGHGEQIYTLTFDSNGNLIDSGYSESATGNLAHLTSLLC